MRHRSYVSGGTRLRTKSTPLPEPTKGRYGRLDDKAYRTGEDSYDKPRSRLITTDTSGILTDYYPRNKTHRNVGATSNMEGEMMSQGVTERQHGIVAHLGHRPGSGGVQRIRTKTTKGDRDFVCSIVYCSPEGVTDGRRPFVLEQSRQARSRANSVNNSGFGTSDKST